MNASISPFQCPVCLKTFPSISGKETHLSQAKACRWYRLKELDSLPEDLPEVQSTGSREIREDLSSREEEDYFVNYVNIDDIPNYQALIPPQSEEESQPQAPRRLLQALDEDNNKRIVETHPTAGKVMGKVTDPDGDVTMAEENGENYTPFSSELDWKFAEWAVKDGIGHNSLDRLLSIPGVRSYNLV